MITGSNAYGEVLPPHFQFTSSAQTDEGKMITVDCGLHPREVNEYRDEGKEGIGKEGR